MEFEEHSDFSVSDAEPEDEESGSESDSGSEQDDVDDAYEDDGNTDRPVKKKKYTKEEIAAQLAILEQRRVKINSYANRVLRIQQYNKWKQAWSKLKAAEKKIKKKEARKNASGGSEEPTSSGTKTIENQRLPDSTTLTEDDQEVLKDISTDEFSNYFERSYVPKILIVSPDKPHTKTRMFMRELGRLFPNMKLYWRNNVRLKKLIEAAKEKGFTDLVVVNEDNKRPDGLMVIHLPDGPTAYFKLSSVKLTKDLRKNYKHITTHRPEIILTNFTTRLGNGVSRMLASLFHYDPEFRGRRVVTFHNQRDYIFVRHHLYHFKNEQRVNLRELGPRFTLKLRYVQKGTFDSTTGEYTWNIQDKRHRMETSRRKFYL